VQIEMLLEIADLVERAAAWLLYRKRLTIGPEIGRFAPSVRSIASSLFDLLPPTDRNLVSERSPPLRRGGRARSARNPHRRDNVSRCRARHRPIWRNILGKNSTEPRGVYYAVGAQFALDEMRIAARRLRAETPWQKQAVEATIDDLFVLQTDLAARILASSCSIQPEDPIAAWSAAHAAALAPAEPLLRELRVTCRFPTWRCWLSPAASSAVRSANVRL